jgi:hypothetical protein
MQERLGLFWDEKAGIGKELIFGSAAGAWYTAKYRPDQHTQGLLREARSQQPLHLLVPHSLHDLLTNNFSSPSSTSTPLSLLQIVILKMYLYF